MKLELPKLRVSSRVKAGATVATAALAFSIIGLSGGNLGANVIPVAASNTLGNSSLPQGPVTEEQQKLDDQAAEARDIFHRQLMSGTRSTEEIAEAIQEEIGDSPGVEFDKRNFDRAYKLTRVMSYYRSGHKNPYEILFTHAFRRENLAEDGVTFYNRKINGPDERSVSSLMVVPRRIEINERREPVIRSEERQLYGFQLDANGSRDEFRMRDPEGKGGFSEIRPDVAALDPFQLVGKDEFFESGSYENQMIDDSPERAVWNTKVTVRPTEIGTVTFDVIMHKAGSSTVQRSILVYERL